MLLTKKACNSFTVHHRNIHSFAVDLFKVEENFSNTTLSDILQTRTLKYNSRLQTDFARSFVDTNCFGLNSLRYFSSKVWNIAPSNIKNDNNLHIFKNKIRKWEPKECHCDLCRPYVGNLGFIKDALQGLRQFWHVKAL